MKKIKYILSTFCLLAIIGGCMPTDKKAIVGSWTHAETGNVLTFKYDNLYYVKSSNGYRSEYFDWKIIAPDSLALGRFIFSYNIDGDTLQVIKTKYVKN